MRCEGPLLREKQPSRGAVHGAEIGQERSVEHPCLDSLSSNLFDPIRFSRRVLEDRAHIFIINIARQPVLQCSIVVPVVLVRSQPVSKREMSFLLLTTGFTEMNMVGCRPPSRLVKKRIDIDRGLFCPQMAISESP